MAFREVKFVADRTPIPARWLNDMQAIRVEGIIGQQGKINVKRIGKFYHIELVERDIRTPKPFPAVITGSDELDSPPNVWAYTWEEIRDFTFDKDTLTLTLAQHDKPPRFGALIENPAFNLNELGHIAEPADDAAWYLAGVQVHPDFGGDYPDNENTGLRPIGGGGTDKSHAADTVVLMHELQLNGRKVYLFDKQNTHDGEC